MARQLEECDSISRVQFTYTAGLILEGAAYMYNVVSITPISPSTVPRKLALLTAR